MRLHTLPAVVIVAAGLAAGAAAGETAPVCGPSSAHTVASDRQARVYAGSGGVFGCAVGAAPVWLGGSTTNCIGTDRIGPVALAGVRAAYASERCGIDTGSTDVVGRSLGTGRVSFEVPAGTQPGPESYTHVVGIITRTSGAAAWIAVSQSLGRSGATIEVWRVEHRSARRLDAGPAVSRDSLRLRGRRLTWRDGGRTRSATLG